MRDRIRITTYHPRLDELVTLTLAADRPVSWWRSERTDEGYHCVAVCWEYQPAAGVVLCEETTDSRDCDGRFSAQRDAVCPVWPNGRPHLTADGLADWQPLRQGQRDYSAEAAGY